MTEQEIIKALKQNDAKMQRLVYERFGPRLLSICTRYCKDRQLAEDVFVNGFMKIFNSINHFEEKGSFEGWMKRIMINEALMELRKKEPLHLTLDSDFIQPESDFSADADIHAEELMKLVEELPAGYRTVFNLFAIEGYSHKEIAGMLAISEGASKSQLSKARAALQSKLTTKLVAQY